MTSPSVEFQTLIGDLLKADVAVAAIVEARVYDGMPSDGAYPCITFGPSDYADDDSECITGRRETLQLDCWVQANGRLWPARELADAVKAALHEVEAEMIVNALVSIRIEQVRVFRDPDGITGHAVVQVTGIIEET